MLFKNFKNIGYQGLLTSRNIHNKIIKNTEAGKNDKRNKIFRLPCGTGNSFCCHVWLANKS